MFDFEWGFQSVSWNLNLPSDALKDVINFIEEDLSLVNAIAGTSFSPKAVWESDSLIDNKILKSMSESVKAEIEIIIQSLFK